MPKPNYRASGLVHRPVAVSRNRAFFGTIALGCALWWFHGSIFLGRIMTVGLTKRDVAQRQLLTAVRLLLSHGDLVSVVTLATNAWEIIDYFCRRDAVLSMSIQARSNLPQGKRLKLDYINSPYRNFFKHAETDADVVLPCMTPAFVDGLIYLAVEDYLRWAKKGPIEFQVFQLWYLALYTEKVADDELNRIIEVVDRKFPNIRILGRDAQIDLGRRVLDEAMRDDELLNHCRTETSF
jgi:hypothetical protein